MSPVVLICCSATWPSLWLNSKCISLWRHTCGKDFCSCCSVTSLEHLQCYIPHGRHYQSSAVTLRDINIITCGSWRPLSSRNPGWLFDECNTLEAELEKKFQHSWATIVKGNWRSPLVPLNMFSAPVLNVLLFWISAFLCLGQPASSALY